MPIAARIQQLRNRATAAKQRRNPKHFKGATCAASKVGGAS